MEIVAVWQNTPQRKQQNHKVGPKPQIRFICPECGGTKLVQDSNGFFMHTLEEFEGPIYRNGTCYVGDYLVYYGDDSQREEIPEEQRYRNPTHRELDPDWDINDPDEAELIEEFNLEFVVYRCGNPKCNSKPLSFEKKNPLDPYTEIGDFLYQPRDLYDWLIDHGMLEDWPQDDPKRKIYEGVR